MLKRFLPALVFLSLLAWPWPALALEQQEETYYTSDDAWTYTLVHTVTVENQAQSYTFDIDITVPLLDPVLPLYNEKVGEQLLPYPDQVNTDEAGHRFALYHIDSIPGGGSVVLTQKYVIQVESISYTFDRAGVAESYSQLELMRNHLYLQPTAQVQSADPAILAFTVKALAGETNPYRQASALFAAVNLALDYIDIAPGDKLDQSAVATLSRGTGNCVGYTNLYLACLRAAGVPARQVSGYLYMPDQHVSGAYIDSATGAVRLDSLAHAWTEFYLPDLGWVLADPTVTYTYQSNGAVQKFVPWKYFANIDPSRRYLTYRLDSGENGDIRLSSLGGWLEPEISATLVAGKDYLPFNDINGHWAAGAITYGVERGLFSGVSASTFSPEQAVTRAMFVTVLGRLYEAWGGHTTPYSSDISQFRDIREDSYYAKYLGWALDGQLIQGYGQGRFGPDDPITREQMAKIIHDFLVMLEVTAEEDNMTPIFTDSRAISDWARPGVSACVGLSLITGQPDGSFQPKKNASRGQVAAILQRLDNLAPARDSSQIQ